MDESEKTILSVIHDLKEVEEDIHGDSVMKEKIIEQRESLSALLKVCIFHHK